MLNFHFNYKVLLVPSVLSFNCVVLLVLSRACSLLALLLRLGWAGSSASFVVPSLSTRESITDGGEHVY